MTIGVSMSDPAPSGTTEDKGKVGSVTPAVTPAPTGAVIAGSTGSPAPTGTEGTKPWYDDFKDASVKAFAQTKNWSDQEAAFKSHMELERKLSERVATTQAPTDPKDYTFDTPKLADGMAFDKGFEDAFRGMAHKAGLSADQAKQLHSAYADYASTTFGATQAAQQQSVAERVTKAAATLEDAFKSKMGSPTFSRQVEMGKRAIRMLDPALGDALKEAGVIVNTGGQDMVANPTLFAVFAKVGATMFAEDRLYGEAAQIANPFDPKTENLDAQGQTMRSDPGKAAMLIRQAGREKMFASWLSQHKL